MRYTKKDFPFFTNNPNTVYLDSTATSLKPAVVIQKINEYYKKYSANVERGLYYQSIKSSEMFWQSRKLTAKFINAKKTDEIVFTHGATESLNLIAFSLGYSIIRPDDEVVLSIMEHHSNFVPWQMLTKSKCARLRAINLNSDYKLSLYNKNTQEIDKSLLQKNINNRTKVLALTYVSNVLGTINPVAEIIKLAKEINPSIITVVDAAQAAPHMPIDIQELGCDFLVFSSHKMLGPTGVGVLWGKYDLLTQMKPYQYGGEMIDKVSLDETTFKAPPHKFEAGTPNIAGVIAHKEAINYLLDIGMENIRSHEKKIMRYAVQSLKESFGEEIKIYGPNSCDDRGGVISFSLCDYHPHDVAHILDEQSICIRAGNHCAQPLHDYLGANSTSRASFYIYNDERDVDLLVNGLKKVKEVLK